VHTAWNLPDKNAIDFFEQNADYYHATQYRTGRRTFINARHDVLTALINRLPVSSTTTALDAGCGAGNLTRVLTERGCAVAAIDTSPRMLQIARSFVAPEALSRSSFAVASIDVLPFANARFDIVCSSGVIEYLPSYEPTLAEFERILRPGGLLVLPTTNLLAFAHWARPIQQAVARIPAVATLFGVKSAHLHSSHHYIPKFRHSLVTHGFTIEQERYFYLTFPRPLDRLWPAATRAIESFFEPRMPGPIRHLAEGYVTVARKRAGQHT
jgi:SAM-dependent methyltransferase